MLKKLKKLSLNYLNDILFNINIDLYYNNDAFNFIDAILNKDNNYSIIKINK